MDNLMQEIEKNATHKDSISNFKMKMAEKQEPVFNQENKIMHNSVPFPTAEQLPKVDSTAEQPPEVDPKDGWEEPMLFDSKKLPVFNIDVFPTDYKNFVDELAEEMQTPVDMPAMAVLTALSSCVAGKFHVHLYGQWREPTNLYSIIAMPPSSKKSPVHKEVTRCIREYEENKRAFLKPDVIHMLGEIHAKEKAVEGLSADYKNARKKGKGNEILEQISKLRDEVEDLKNQAVLPTYIIGGDATPEKVADLMQENNECLAIISPEGNDLFSMMSGRYTDKPYLELYLMAYTGEPYSMKRIRRDVDLKHPYLTIGLFVQNSVIKDSDRSFKERGLMQRFLYCMPASNAGTRKIRPQVMSERARLAYKNRVIEMMQFDPKEEVELTLSPEADKTLKDMQTVNERELGNSDIDDAYKEWKGKLIGNIIRIAGILHVAECFEGYNTKIEISKETFDKAGSLYYYLSAHAEEAFAISSGQGDETDEKKLYKLILDYQKDGKVGRRDVQKKSNYFNNAQGSKRLQAAEIALVDRNIIRTGYIGKKKAYEISPYILESLKKH